MGRQSSPQTDAAGSVITLSAAPAALNTFGAWAGACTGSDACQVTMSEHRLVAATFIPPRYTVMVVGAGNGTGDFVEPLGQTFGNPPLGCRIRQGKAVGTCTSQFPLNKRVRL